ncbi:MAG: nitrite/sulfite reductase, partial [Alphaproteobacteria bacterium]
ARFATDALKLLLGAFAGGRQNGEGVRDWALRLGKDGLKNVMKPITERSTEGNDKVFVDWGESEKFHTPEAAMAECAAPYAVDNLLRDLADDGLIALDRAIRAGRPSEALRFGREGLYYAVRRLLLRHGHQATDATHEEAIMQVRAAYGDDGAVLGALAEVEGSVSAAADGGGLDAFREALALFIDLAAERVSQPVDMGSFEIPTLADSSGAVAAALRAQGAAE